jgi:hypothetical protein
MGRTFVKRVLAAAVGVASAAIADAGSLDRLKSVSQHAKGKASGGPEHLWLGISIFAVLALVVVLSAWWTLSRKKR